MKKKIMTSAVLILYCCILLYITVISRKTQTEKQFDLSLLHTYYSLWYYEWNYAAKYVLLEVLGNVVMFLPIGTIVGVLFYPHFDKKGILLGLGFSMIIECTQYLTGRGAFQVVDLLHNTVGTTTGMALYFTLVFLENGKFRKYKKEIYKTYIPIIILLIILTIASIRPILREMCRLI